MVIPVLLNHRVNRTEGSQRRVGEQSAMTGAIVAIV